MAALHALIVGVSAYPHLPGGDGVPGPDYEMGQLTASAASAAAVKDWLEAAGERLAAPLESVRLLLSPSAVEIESDRRLADAEPATRESFRRAALAWREDCASDPDNVAFFYFAGHGVVRTRWEFVLLLSDFADALGNPLFNAVDVNNLFGGMAPTVSRPSMARTQLWFFDSCRVFPSQFDHFETLTVPGVFEVEMPDSDRRCAPVYFGASQGGAAYAVPGGRTLFSRALLEGLDSAGGEKLEGENRWVVTAGSLLRGMQAAVDRINAEEDGDQVITGGGIGEHLDRQIVELSDVPTVDVRLELVPAHRAAKVTLAFHGPDGEPKDVPIPLEPNPFRDRWQAGSYRLQTTPAIAGVDHEVPVRPPAFKWRATVP